MELRLTFHEYSLFKDSIAEATDFLVDPVTVSEVFKGEAKTPPDVEIIEGNSSVTVTMEDDAFIEVVYRVLESLGGADLNSTGDAKKAIVKAIKVATALQRLL